MWIKNSIESASFWYQPSHNMVAFRVMILQVIQRKLKVNCHVYIKALGFSPHGSIHVLITPLQNDILVKVM